MSLSRRRFYAVAWAKVCCPADEFGIADKYSSDLITTHAAVLSEITALLSKIAKLIETLLIELAGLPEPSAYAHLVTWRDWQEEPTAILNLRPPTNQGLPVETLHPVFAAFRDDIRLMRVDEWAQESDANTTSMDLCNTMANSFDNETARRTILKELLRDFSLDLTAEYYIPPTLPRETHSVRADLHLSAGTRTVLLGEIKVEFESGDPYMQVSRAYQALVHHLQEQGKASDGVPCILLAVCGQ